MGRDTDTEFEALTRDMREEFTRTYETLRMRRRAARAGGFGAIGVGVVSVAVVGLWNPVAGAALFVLTVLATDRFLNG